MKNCQFENYCNILDYNQELTLILGAITLFWSSTFPILKTENQIQNSRMKSWVSPSKMALKSEFINAPRRNPTTNFLLRDVTSPCKIWADTVDLNCLQRRTEFAEAFELFLSLQTCDSKKQYFNCWGYFLKESIMNIFSTQKTPSRSIQYYGRHRPRKQIQA